MPGYHRLVLIADRRNVRNFRWMTKAGAAMNLTGSTAEFRVLDPSDDEIFACTTGDGITLGGATGRITVDISQAKATGLHNRELQFGLAVTDSDGVLHPLISGDVVFKLVGER